MNTSSVAANTANAAANTAHAVQADVQQQVSQGMSALDHFTNFLLDHGPDLIYAIIIFFVGRAIARFIKNMVVRFMTHANSDRTVITFISQIVYYAIMAFVVLTALNKIGIPTNSFLAAFGAFGLAVGLALQSNLSNFASGLLILIFKPFKAGDWVSIGGVEGSVKGIQVLNTAIITKDKKQSLFLIRRLRLRRSPTVPIWMNGSFPLSLILATTTTIIKPLRFSRAFFKKTTAF